MSDNRVEDRLASLEQHVRQIMERLDEQSDSPGDARNWRKSLGMFDDRPAMNEIDEAGRQLRQQDREQMANDHT